MRCRAFEQADPGSGESMSATGVIIVAMRRGRLGIVNPLGAFWGHARCPVQSTPVPSSPFVWLWKGPDGTGVDIPGCLVMKGSPVRVRASALKYPLETAGFLRSLANRSGT
jgi:hypothetical protein